MAGEERTAISQARESLAENAQLLGWFAAFDFAAIILGAVFFYLFAAIDDTQCWREAGQCVRVLHSVVFAVQTATTVGYGNLDELHGNYVQAVSALACIWTGITHAMVLCLLIDFAKSLDRFRLLARTGRNN